MNTIRKAIEDRDKAIYTSFKAGVRQKVIAKMCGLSPSRVKAIVGQMRKLESV